MKRRREAYIKQYSKLIGKQVVSLVEDEEAAIDFGEPLFGLRFHDGTIAWILRDPEGNGPGHLNIEDPT